MCNLAEPLQWAGEPGRPAADAPAVGPLPAQASRHPLPQLSAHEARCLLQRIAALREQAQLAVLGADAARDAVPACALQGICQALHEAEAAIAHAQELAARALH
ncbi:hypothetical protein [Azohydromonas lata]|uniref:Uncharacterized protein n=1 Tax=Azohydromonas lata TaxID=45677 RepID=A0ABU5ILV4_9BURK|nr:hypothetical protein [Azohydromonas lata]MDZ5459885.1 hypothetical protein [Azohydromonas lata]